MELSANFLRIKLQLRRLTGFSICTSAMASEIASALCDYELWFLWYFVKYFKRVPHILKLLISVICGALRDLVAFVQFKKREKHPWRSVLPYIG